MTRRLFMAAVAAVLASPLEPARVQAIGPRRIVRKVWTLHEQGNCTVRMDYRHSSGKWLPLRDVANRWQMEIGDEPHRILLNRSISFATVKG